MWGRAYNFKWMYCVDKVPCPEANFLNVFCWMCRHYLMEDTRVAFTGLWWTGTRRGDHWCSSCALERTRWWLPHRILFAEKGQGSTRISNGQICLNSHKSTTELTMLPSKTLPNGFYPPILLTTTSLPHFLSSLST